MGIENEDAVYKKLGDETKERMNTATDMEVAFFLMEHIDNPCFTNLPTSEKVNIREFYLRQAEEIIPKMTNEDARALLENKIKEYRK